MLNSPFRRLVLVISLASLLVGGYFIKRDISAIFSFNHYVYEPWSSVEEFGGLRFDVVKALSLEHVTGYEYGEWLHNQYRTRGYSVCWTSADIFLPCTTRKYGLGSYGLTFPVKGSDEQGGSFPALRKNQGGVSVVDIPLFNEDSRNNPDVSVELAWLWDLARKEYIADVWSQIHDKLWFWALYLFGPSLGLLTLATLTRWVRQGRVPALHSN